MQAKTSAVGQLFEGHFQLGIVVIDLQLSVGIRQFGV